ncbi:MAG TPA: hypothetical protein VJM15_10420 [Sphingomicrobium sp.]|nr:hypothetical protein [Sphingomicrobium sp.]
MFQTFSADAAPINRRDPSASPPRDEVRKLIARYPNLNEIELARLINLYRRLPAVDMALMLSDEKLAPNLDRFSSNHRSDLRPPFRDYAGLMLYVGITIAVLVWAIAVAI